MDKTPGQTISPLTETGGSVVGDIISHVMDESTVDIPPPTPLHQFLPLPLPPPPLPPIPDPHTPSPQRHSPGQIPTTRSHSTVDKSGCHGRKWFEDHCGFKQKINRTHPFCQWFLRNTIVSRLIPGCEEEKTISPLDYFLLLFPPNKLIYMIL